MGILLWLTAGFRWVWRYSSCSTVEMRELVSSTREYCDNGNSFACITVFTCCLSGRQLNSITGLLVSETSCISWWLRCAIWPTVTLQCTCFCKLNSTVVFG